MKRLLDHLRTHLARRSPATLGLGELEDALRRDRVPVTRSAVESTIRGEPSLTLLDPWRGANRGLGWRRHERRVTLAPPEPDLASPCGGVPDENGPARSRFGDTRATGVELDRSVRTLGARGDVESVTMMARWIRLNDEAARATGKARRRWLRPAA